MLKWKSKSLGRVQLFATPWSVALQAPLSMGFASQEYWSGVPFATPGAPPNQVSCIGRQILYHWATREGLIDHCELESTSEVKWKLLSPVQLFVTPWTLESRPLEWVAFPFSRGSSQPRDLTQVSHIAGRFFTNWAIRKVLLGGKWGEILDSSSLTPYTWFSLCSGNYMFKICVYFIFSLHLHC